MFLNSSLNVELVYIILKSITSFGVDIRASADTSRKSKITIDPDSGNGSIVLKKIKIKNYQDWSKNSNVRNTQVQTMVLKEAV